MTSAADKLAAVQIQSQASAEQTQLPSNALDSCGLLSLSQLVDCDRLTRRRIHEKREHELRNSIRNLMIC